MLVFAMAPDAEEIGALVLYGVVIILVSVTIGWMMVTGRWPWQRR